MIKIKKGSKTMSVPNSAFENFYKGAGWEKEDDFDTVYKDEEPADLVESNEEPDVLLPVEEEEIEDDEWAGYEDEEIEKPLSEMTDAEIKEKAASLGISTKGLSIKQIREKIKNHSV